MRRAIPSLILLLTLLGMRAGAQETSSTSPQAQAASNTGGHPLTIQEAEAIGLRNNPQITVGKLQALAAREFVREVRSVLMPQVSLNLTGVGADAGSRLSAGYLTNGRMFPRAAGGVAVSQLITDFGRTMNLLSSSQYQEKAADQNAVATVQQIVLVVDQSFYNTLETKALLRVAEDTVKARQLFADQIQALTTAKNKTGVPQGVRAQNERGKF